MEKKSEKGVSLIITFFIMTIILSVVLGLSLILYSQLKIIKNIGNSVAAFYAADSGMEKTLYYIRNKIPDGVVVGTSGLCNLCDTCVSNSSPFKCEDCRETSTSGLNGCEYSDPNSGSGDFAPCSSCSVSFWTSIDGTQRKKYDITANISPRQEEEDMIQRTDITAKGYYDDTSRALEIIVNGMGAVSNSNPRIDNITFRSRTVLEYTELYFSMDIIDNDGIGRAVAYIQSPDDVSIDQVTLINTPVLGRPDFYEGTWVGRRGVYFVDIVACDSLGNCSTSTNI